MVLGRAGAVRWRTGLSGNLLVQRQNRQMPQTGYPSAAKKAISFPAQDENSGAPRKSLRRAGQASLEILNEGPVSSVTGRQGRGHVQGFDFRRMLASMHPLCCPVCGRDSISCIERQTMVPDGAKSQAALRGVLAYRCERGHVFLARTGPLAKMSARQRSVVRSEHRLCPPR